MGEIKAEGIMPGSFAGETLPDAEPPAVIKTREPKLFLVHGEIHSANLGQTLALAAALHAEHWDVHIVCRSSCSLAVSALGMDLPVHAIPDDESLGFFAAWRLVRLVRKLGLRNRETGLLHACDPTASHLVARAWRLNRKLRILHTRRTPVMEVAQKSVRCYQSPAAEIITDSLAGKIALRLSGLEPHLLHSIACGFDPSSQPVRQERHDGRIVFAVIGDLLPWSGHSLLFDALALLEKDADLPPWEVRILGNGSQLQTLLEEARAKDILGRLAFLGGMDTVSQLSQCDILVLPFGEGESHMPLILQGWAARLPLVAVNRLDHAENFQGEGNCLLAQPGNVASLAAQMARLAKDKELCTHLVSGGLASLAKFPLGSMVLEYKRLYRRILA